MKRKRIKLKDMDKQQIINMLLSKQQKIIVNLAIHYYQHVIDTVPVVTGLTRTSFTVGVNAPDKYDPAEGHYGLPSAPSPKELLAQLQGKELKLFIGTAVGHKGMLEERYQTQYLAWADLVKYAQQEYPGVF